MSEWLRFIADQPLAALVLVISVLLLAQAMFSLYLMLYAWEHPERLSATQGPQVFAPPQLSFTVLLPARHEEDVIYHTIRRVLAANYPPELLEVVVICSADDTGTINEAERAIADERGRARVLSFTDGPINKPHGLNVGLYATSNDVVTIFDAEDDMDPNVFNVINTTMIERNVGIVQAGVQLMNFRDHWFAVHNVLEYFFWFKSRLHFHARVGMIPLGGNTVFIRRNLLEQIGGWDEQCLTEDAEIGLRLSVLGEPITVVYDPQHVTREETPDSVGQFVKQRTRWHQGFIQVLRKGVWRRLPKRRQRLLALYTFSYPLFHALLTFAWPVMLAAVIWLRLPVLVAMVSFLPAYALFFQYVLSVVGVIVLTREYRLRFPPLIPIAMAITFLPFQWLLGYSAIRAVYRELRRHNNWEKTAHIGAHRRGATAVAAGYEAVTGD